MRPHSNVSAISRIVAICIILIVALTAVLSTYFIFEGSANSPSRCDEQLSKATGATNFCLNPLTIEILASNSSDYNVPVLVIRPGTTAQMSILYHLAVNGISGSSTHVRPNLTSTTVPYALSADSGRISNNEVKFENATMVFQNETWVLFSYNVKASSNSSRYYAILPPFYYGFYPAIAVEPSSGNLNYSELTMWGFDGIIESGEFVIPSTIVATSNLNLVNVTVPGTTICPNAACSVIIHRGY
ncbi:MAG TPA: hypothetical protein VFF30_04270 [Nitrososphaerales archaeon]|nr:hypothetical protein [Nitrososphaerales archaeon]